MNISVALITRFNVRPTEPREVKAPLNDLFNVNDRQWLDDRMHMFETFCAPSIRAQTDHDFTWFALVDEGLPVADEEAIASAGYCHVIRCSSRAHGLAQVRAQITQGARLSLTIRCNADESIPEDLIADFRDLAEWVAPALKGDKRTHPLVFDKTPDHSPGRDPWRKRNPFRQRSDFLGFLEVVPDDPSVEMVFEDL